VQQGSGQPQVLAVDGSIASRRAARPASLRPSTPKTSWRLPWPLQPSQPIAPANPVNARTTSPAALALKAQEARRERRFEQSRKGPAFQSTSSSGVRGSARSSPLVARQYCASAVRWRLLGVDPLDRGQISCSRRRRRAFA
jgi:hypothetical protein